MPTARSFIFSMCAAVASFHKSWGSLSDLFNCEYILYFVFYSAGAVSDESALASLFGLFSLPSFSFALFLFDVTGFHVTLQSFSRTEAANWAFGVSATHLQMVVWFSFLKPRGNVLCL